MLDQYKREYYLNTSNVINKPFLYSNTISRGYDLNTSNVINKPSFQTYSFPKRII